MPYYIPRDTKGEGRILYIFSTKGLIYTGVGAGIGLIFYWILSLIGLKTVGLIIVLLLGIIGFCLGTLKVPDIKTFEFTRKTGGLNLDQVILTAIKFKRNRKIYVYTNEVKEETKDE